MSCRPALPSWSSGPRRRTPISIRCAWWRFLLACGLVVLAGCAEVMPRFERIPETARVAPPDAPLARAVREARLPSGRSGVWPLLQAGFALDARLAMIENATTSLDLQTYLLADDSTGRAILRALRDAARRGVRIRLLVDDLYTRDLDRLLLGLAAEPNAEVRLFNPFVTFRASTTRRLLALALDFGRLNHRMHNKLFVADGVLAIVGGRNLADEYFLRGAVNNFIDFDVLLAGAVVPGLSGWFDLYWNSTVVYPVDAIVRAAGGTVPDPVEAGVGFDEATRADARPDPPLAPDFFGAMTFSQTLAKHALPFIAAEATSYADSPDKIDPKHRRTPADDTLTVRYLQSLASTRREAFLFSPYFIPGQAALATISKLRTGGVTVRIVTNTLAISDEPLVNIRYERQQRALLEMGVELFELSSNRLKLDDTLKDLLGASTGRLHAKIAFLDRTDVLVGSMNLDPRSATINTEIGVRIVSPRLADMVLAAFKVDAMAGVYQVKLRPDAGGVRWVAVDNDAPEELEINPDTSRWQRLRLLLLSLLVPESQL